MGDQGDVPVPRTRGGAPLRLPQLSSAQRILLGQWSGVRYDHAVDAASSPDAEHVVVAAVRAVTVGFSTATRVPVAHPTNPPGVPVHPVRDSLVGAAAHSLSVLALGGYRFSDAQYAMFAEWSAQGDPVYDHAMRMGRRERRVGRVVPWPAQPPVIVRRDIAAEVLTGSRWTPGLALQTCFTACRDEYSWVSERCARHPAMTFADYERTVREAFALHHLWLRSVSTSALALRSVREACWRMEAGAEGRTHRLLELFRYMTSEEATNRFHELVARDQRSALQFLTDARWRDARRVLQPEAVEPLLQSTDAAVRGIALSCLSECEGRFYGDVDVAAGATVEPPDAARQGASITAMRAS